MGLLSEAVPSISEKEQAAGNVRLEAGGGPLPERSFCLWV